MTTSRVRFCGTWVLQGNATLRLPAGDGAVVRVERGTVLEPGDELVLSRPGLAVAWAFTDAALSINPAIHRLAA